MRGMSSAMGTRGGSHETETMWAANAAVVLERVLCSA